MESSADKVSEARRIEIEYFASEGLSRGDLVLFSWSVRFDREATRIGLMSRRLERKLEDHSALDEPTE
jgi:hypothetical protein